MKEYKVNTLGGKLTARKESKVNTMGGKLTC